MFENMSDWCPMKVALEVYLIKNLIIILKYLYKISVDGIFRGNLLNNLGVLFFGSVNKEII